MLVFIVIIQLLGLTYWIYTYFIMHDWNSRSRYLIDGEVYRYKGKIYRQMRFEKENDSHVVKLYWDDDEALKKIIVLRHGK